MEDVKETTATEETVEKPKKEQKNRHKEEITKQKEEISRLKKEIDDLKNALLLNRADLENFKKHMKDEAIKDRKYASLNLISDIIVPLEYLSKACEYQSSSQ